MRRLFAALTRHWISLLGAALTTATGLLIVVLFGVLLVGYEGGPYVGILAYLVLPALFVLGLILMPFGVWLGRRRALPVVDLNRDVARRSVLAFLAATAINVVILGVATYKGVEVMESVSFCGTTCHTVMHPEHTAYQRSAHANVACVTCHIGAGAGSFAKAKLNGSWQAIATIFDLYDRPISTSLHDLPPAQETCERCHWRSKQVGERLKVITRFDADERNTPKKTVLLMRVGSDREGTVAGAHWHVSPGIQIRYRADAAGRTITTVELTRPDGMVKTYRADGSPDDHAPAAKADWRVMDCLDCHNRPAHVFRLAAEELDSALERGTIDRTLPFIKREGLAALQDSYASHEEARSKIPARIGNFYAQGLPDRLSSRAAAIDAAASSIAEIYCANVFPVMNIGWGAYPNDIGHQDSGGCFRCHDELHKTADGQAISQDCSTCHALLAVEEEDPQILSQLRP